MSTILAGRIALALPFASGLAAVAWVGAGFVGTHPLALGMSAVIGAVYLLGAVEVLRFRAATATLDTALAALQGTPEDLDAWLARVDPALRGATRLRIEDGRALLPGLALTPYLVGLLVMLGMLGTFLGMVATFRGTVFALEGSTDLVALRGALAAPIRGLGLAFGTSVAGVAASAMLGLMSAIVRRDRLAVARRLDAQLATVLKPFSGSRQRERTADALRVQAEALPEAVRQLQALFEQNERRNRELDAALLERQERFHRDASAAYTALADAVRQSLVSGVEASARATGETVRTATASTLEAIADESRRAREQLAATTQAQLGQLMDGLAARTGAMTEAWTASEQQSRAAWTAALESTAATLQEEWRRTGAQTLAGQQAAVAALEAGWQRAGEQALAQQQSIGRALQASATEIGESAARQARHTQEDIARLLAQSEALVQARAESEQRWQQQLAERDAAALQERASLTAQIHTLLQSVAQATDGQRAAIESLVRSAGAVLEQVGRQFSETLDAQTARAEGAAAQVAGSAIELASLGEAFHHGVQLSTASHERLIDGLRRIEAALGQSLARSDEQLAYYVAQAREVIDLSISSQQGILEDLRRLQRRSAAEEMA